MKAETYITEEDITRLRKTGKLVFQDKNIEVVLKYLKLGDE